MYILVVEDEPQIAKNLAELLENEGHQSAVAHTIAEARRHINAHPPEVVFLDVHLPDGSGLDLLATEAVPFIVITGTPAEETLDTAFQRGAVAYLVKPFTLSEVLEALAQVGKAG
jgi:two-component system response regulator AtoC